MCTGQVNWALLKGDSGGLGFEGTIEGTLQCHDVSHCVQMDEETFSRNLFSQYENLEVWKVCYKTKFILLSDWSTLLSDPFKITNKES